MTDQALADRPAEESPTRRPSTSDEAVTRAAAKTFSEEAAKSSPGILKGSTAEQFAEDVLAILPVWDVDGVELAQAMNRRYGYDVTRELIDLMAQWDGHVSDAREALVRAWVASTKPVPPFDGVARVRVKDGTPASTGVAYASDRYTGMAQCLVVPDGEDRYVRDGAFAGGQIVEWERIVVTGPANESDRELYQASLDTEDRHARERALQTFSHGRNAVYADALKAADKANAGIPDDDLRRSLQSSLRELADAVGQAGTEVPAPLAAQVVSAIQAVRSRETRAAFKGAANTPGAT